MKNEYDFSRAERGRFYREGAIHAPPVHLDADVRAALQARADGQGISLGDLVNALLRSTIVPTEARPALKA